MKNTISIGIAEDHSILRQGLISLLKSYKNITIQFEVSNGKELLEELKIIRPSILLLDLEMPILRGQDVLEKIRKKYPKIKIIIVSGFFSKDYILECFKYGVKAFLPKDLLIENIVDAIVSVHENDIYSDPIVTKILADEFLDLNLKATGKPTFSDSEMKVLTLMCKGNTRRKAAEILKVKHETVNFHMSNIMRKTKIHNVTALINFVMQNKLMDFDA